jgi:hypothetical protein
MIYILDHIFRRIGISLTTTVRKNMKAKAISLWDRAMLSRRYIIETINDHLSIFLISDTQGIEV